MSDLGIHVGDYLRLRRSLGYKLEREGVVLPRFVQYMEDAGAITVTTDLAVSWAQLPEGGSAKLRRDRLIAVRGFAKYMTTIDAATQVPPAGVFGFRATRPTPYLWSLADISRLLDAAAGLRSPFRATTYVSFLGLLAVTGLRSGEAMGLRANDVDLNSGLITISQAKFGRARLIPLHDSTLTALDSYAQRRDELHPRPKSETFFVTDAGTSLKQSSVDSAFGQLIATLGLRTENAHPRMHDLRH